MRKEKESEELDEAYFFPEKKRRTHIINEMYTTQQTAIEVAPCADDKRLCLKCVYMVFFFAGSLYAFQ